jgi:superfamily II DNA or RNA helicase
MGGDITGRIQQINRNLNVKVGFELNVWQEDTIAGLLAGGDVVTVAPTGGGKSMCFAFVLYMEPSDSIVLIIEPTKALINDQV